MPIYDSSGNIVAGTANPVPSYNRCYAYINPELLCERKDLNNDGTLSDSTTRCVIYLPRNGCVEVRTQKATAMFKVAKVYGSTVTWLDADWSYYTTRYAGDNTSDYYAVVAATSAGTAEITEKETVERIAVYQFVDVGVNRYVTSSLNGKKVAFIGDSITQGVYRKFSTTELTWTAAKPFPGLVAEIANDTNHGNFGIDGAPVSGSSWKSLLTNCSKIVGYDVVFICGGTNDYGGNKSSSVFTTDYQSVVDTLKANNTEVVACTPIYRTQKTGPNTQGLTLEDYCTMIKNISVAKGIKCIDLYPLTDDEAFMNYVPDGLHPNEIGHKIMADLIVDEYEKLSS